MDTQILKIRQLISRNKLIDAFNQIKLLDLDLDENNSITILSSRFYEINKMWDSGVIDINTLNIEKNKIRTSFLNILNEIQLSNVAKVQMNEPNESTSKHNSVIMKGKYVAGRDIIINKEK